MTPMSRSFLLITLLCLLTLSRPESCSACTCMRPEIITATASSAVVFEGVLRSTSDPRAGATSFSSADPLGYSFEVLRIWKGPAVDTLLVYSSRSEASCGYQFNLDTEYLVFASRTAAGNLRTGLCSGTTPLSRGEETIRFLEELGIHGDEAHFDSLLLGRTLERIRIGDEAERSKAIGLLGTIQGPSERILPALNLITVTGTVSDRKVAAHVAGVKCRNGQEPFLQYAIRACGDTSAEVRAFAIRALGYWGTRSASVESTLFIAARDSEAPVRRAALDVLARNSEFATAFPVMLAGLDDDDFRVREGALRALRTAPLDVQVDYAGVRRALEDSVASVRCEALHTLQELYPDSVAALVPQVWTDPTPGVRQSVLSILRANDGEWPDHEAILTEAVGDPDSEVRSAALYHWSSLTRSRPIDTLKPLGRFLQDPDATIRERAVQSLRNLLRGCDGVFVPPEDWVRPTVFRMLQGASRDSTAEVREAGIRMLMREFPAEWLENQGLVELEDPSPRVREAIVMGLVWLDLPAEETERCLRLADADSSEYVRRAAERVRKQLWGR